ncbi:MAG: creatininase family protein [Pseudomonadota bacterium]
MADVLWERMSAPALQDLARRDAVVIVPVAAIEQHGPHLPTMTDTRIGGEIALRAARRATDRGRPTVVTPVISAGLSEHHMAFGGTITLSHETFQRVVGDTVESAMRHGFDKFVISNSHGGNHIASQAAAEALAMSLGVTVIATTYFSEAADVVEPLLEDQDEVQHACEAETSMMMALEPDLVDVSALASLATDTSRLLSGTGRASFRWRSFTERTDNGVIGNPARATAAKGEALLDAISTCLAELIVEDASWD